MYQYFVKYYDEISNNFRDARGLIGGCYTYSAAVAEVVAYYGEKVVITLTIEYVGDDSCSNILEYNVENFDIHSVTADY